MAKNEEGFLSISDACDYLGVSRTHLWSLCKRKKLQRYKLPDGKKNWLRKTDVDSLLRPVSQGVVPPISAGVG